MYSVEHDAQPEIFSNAFSGIWWSASTLLTVGYGDIYPVTTMGKLLGTVIAFLGVGMVAIPTGIISAGFVEQYSQFKRFGDYAVEEDISFIQTELARRDAWIGIPIRDLGLPQGMLIAAIRRNGDMLIPKGDVVLQERDELVIGAQTHQGSSAVRLREVTLGKKHDWNGQMIRDLDISRRTLVVMIKRADQVIIPDGDLAFVEGDKVFLYTAKRVDGGETVSI
jgi:voltage-gated potassium channel